MFFTSFKWDESTVLEMEDPSSAYVYYRHKRFNLITGFPEDYPMTALFTQLDSMALQSRVDSPTVVHLYYEFGLVLMGLGHSVNEEAPLAVILTYETSKKRVPRKSKLKCLPLKSLERPTWSEYKVAFAKIQEHLLSGDCYQVNLTYPFDFETDETFSPRELSDFFMSRTDLSPFAHASYFGEEMILSNSPECLFQYQGGKLSTMPIKGTVKREKNWKKQWQEILADAKQEGELLMIVDLLRNDLNRLDRPVAEVKRLRAPLLVPGLLHQYALLSVRLKAEVSLLKTLGAIFPGGSITGAPKKKVMEIIQEVERYSRGIYCGSTLLFYEDKKMASINIRTATVSPFDRLWRYGAGGGITLLSRPVDEYNEMQSKVSSFLTLLKTPGY